jgi:hypothetical protein
MENRLKQGDFHCNSASYCGISGNVIQNLRTFPYMICMKYEQNENEECQKKETNSMYTIYPVSIHNMAQRQNLRC